MHEGRASVEEYLEALARITEKKREPTVKEISSMLKISLASVSEMLRRLASFGFIEYEKYGAIRLTEKGRKEGARVLRRHRVIERFLEAIGIRKDRLHDEACVLEHAVSDEVEAALRRMAPEGSRAKVVRLSDLKGGDSATVLLVSGGRAARGRLMEMGLTPGTKITVRHTSTRHGPMEICVRSSCLALGRGIAEKIVVEVSK